MSNFIEGEGNKAREEKWKAIWKALRITCGVLSQPIKG